MFNCILALIGFIVHWFPQHYIATKVIYCINTIIFFLRIMKIYVTNGMLGPKIFMIRRMVGSVFTFVIFEAILSYLNDIN